MKIAITGTIGSGKSEVANYLRELGYDVFDCDKENKKLLEKGNKGYQAVQIYFPECFDDDVLNKKKLAKIVFEDKESKKTLENILHPLILEELKKRTDDPLIAEVPLLFESGWEKYFDRSVLVIAKQEDILKRLEEKGFSSEEATQRIENQMSVKDKLMKANQIIYNGGSLLDLYENVDEWLKSIC